MAEDKVLVKLNKISTAKRLANMVSMINLHKGNIVIKTGTARRPIWEAGRNTGNEKAGDVMMSVGKRSDIIIIMIISGDSNLTLASHGVGLRIPIRL